MNLMKMFFFFHIGEKVFFISTINWHLWCHGLAVRSQAVLCARNLGGPYLEVGKDFGLYIVGWLVSQLDRND